MKYYNSLKNYNDTEYPYSLTFVNESPYKHRHSYCDKDGFHIILESSKHLFTYPNLENFSLSLQIKFADSFMPQILTKFGVLFGYNEDAKSGKKLEFTYDHKEHKFYITIKSFTNSTEVTLQESCINAVMFLPSTTHMLTFNCQGGNITGIFGDYPFNFSLSNNDTYGKLGIYTSAAYKEVVFFDATIETDTNFTNKECFNTTIHLPNKNGGNLPYDLDLSFIQYPDDITELCFTLRGGISSKEIHNCNTNDWNFCYDDIYNPYIELISNNNREKFYLYRDKGMFLDPNAWTHLRKIYETIENVKDTPLAGSFFISTPKYSHYGFGYEKFDAFGTQSMVGGYEYIYQDKNLIYSGLPLDNNVVFCLQSFDKQIEKLIPVTLYDYQRAVEHVRNNHYFLSNENPKFMLNLYSTLDENFINIEFELTDAYLDKICSILPDTVKENENFSVLNYKNYHVYFTLDVLPIGVYHIITKVSYGDRLLSTHRSAFEVIDKSNNISPQEASRLPRMYFGDGGPQGQESGNPDFYSEKAELNWNHYFEIAHYTPRIQEKKKLWELTSIFNRKLFAWMTKRTIEPSDWKKYQNVLQNADYINYFYPGLEDCFHYYRYDLYDKTTYGNQLLAIVQDFIDENPHISKKFNYIDVRKEFTQETFLSLLNDFGVEWINYALPRIEKLFKNQTQELKLLNNKFKRSSYGPLPSYYSPYNSGYATKWYGFNPKTYDDIFDGFLQYEDYPYCCGYATSRGAWMLATSKLLNRRITIFPEVYLNFPYACPDSAVVSAFPPLGYSFHPIYYTLTQMYEYTYNSFYLDKEGFNAWDDYGFSIFNNIDCPYEREEVFLKLWGNLLKHKPKKPLKSIVFLYEIDSCDDRYDLEERPNHFYNISESNFSYIYGLLKQNGFTAGYPVNCDGFLSLDINEISCLVLPNITNFNSTILNKIIQVKEKNIPIICAGQLGKLDRLFNVETHEYKATVTSLKNDSTSEYVTTNSCEFFYESMNDNALLTTNNDDSVILENNGCLIFNSSISQIGIENVTNIHHHGKENISQLLKEAILQWANKNITTIVKADGDVGVSIFKDIHDRTLLLITDYSELNQKRLDDIYIKNIKFNVDDYADAQYIDICNPELPYSKLINNNSLKGLQVSLRPQETVMFELIKKKK